MSTAHRPNFTAAKARAPNRQQSAQISIRDIPSHQKLKFRQPASASASTSTQTDRRDLKRELDEAEWEARNKRRVKEGLEPIVHEGGRKEAIQQALELDRDSDQDADSDQEEEADSASAKPEDDAASSSSDSDSDDSDDSSDDEQALLLAELEKIKAERAAEKTRLASLASTHSQLTTDQQVANGNPLLNLQHALASHSPQPQDQPHFGVQKRWDDDVIFKNQASAAGNTGTHNTAGFVNDLTRSDFHKKFMHRYIK